ncbi:MAG: phosphatidylglycerol lysyltransferase domain-containing protein [Myxococcaceae bacterium]
MTSEARGIEMNQIELELKIAANGRDPIAMSATQPGLSYLQTAHGVIAYERAYGSALSLGGPICAAEHEVELANEFLRKVRGASLFYVPDAIALADHGRYRASLGCDRVLDLDRADTFDAAPVKAAVRKAAKAGLKLSELDFERASDFDLFDLARINEAALKKSVVPFEMRFLNRPMHPSPALSRLFFLEARNERFGYAVLDPYFESGQVKGYLLNLIRFGPTSIWGVYMAVVHALAAQLREEGVRELSLGFCPMSELDLENTSPVLRPQLKWLAKQAEGAEYFKRLREMKGQFNGRWVRRWLVTRSPQLVTPLLSFLKLTGVPVGSWLREQLGIA